jgi:hypothetical protein
MRQIRGVGEAQRIPRVTGDFSMVPRIDCRGVSVAGQGECSMSDHSADFD